MIGTLAAPGGAAFDDGAFNRENAPRSAVIGPNAFVRWAFYLSVFSIPFTRLYIPGTGDRLGVIRLVQLLLLCAVAVQSRVCLRLIPMALVWFAAYFGLRVCSGLWLSPELAGSWWPGTLDWLQYAFPWVWMAFNLLQFPRIGHRGLWALAWGCALCASLHIAGVGVTTVDNTLDEVRTTVFGENANLVGITYAIGVIILIGFSMSSKVKLSRRGLVFPIIALIGIALAKTGSRTALLAVAVGVLVLMFQARSFSTLTARYAVVILTGAVLTVTIWQVPTVIERIGDLDPQTVRRHEPRARMVPVLWEIFLRSPIYGSGPDQYMFELTRRAMPYLLKDQRLIGAHNLILMVLVETGIIGLLVFSAGLGQALVAAWRARLRPCGSLPLAIFLPLFIEGLISGNPTTNQAFWFTVAYALAGAA